MIRVNPSDPWLVVSYQWLWFRPWPGCAGAPAGSRLEIETGELLAAIDEAVPYAGAGRPATNWGAMGISVFFPSAKGSLDHSKWWYGELYPDMRFAQDGWGAFLDAWLAR